jgi:hypothetical protein
MLRLKFGLLAWLAKGYFDKISETYKELFNKDLPTILVVGSLGKSSQALLLRQLFEKAGWKVYSGNSTKNNWNGLAGIIYTLSQNNSTFYNKNQLSQILTFIKLYFNLLFSSYSNLSEKTIFIYEIGFDKQGENYLYENIFENGFKYLITTALTLEHSENYQNKFDVEAYEQIKSLLPEELKKQFESESKNLLKNTALEQLELLKLAEKSIIPTKIGEVTQDFFCNFENRKKWIKLDFKVKRNENLSLMINNRYNTNNNYLLPLTFGRQVYITDLVAREFEIEEKVFLDLLKDFEMPNSRFSILKGKENTNIVDSTYNSDPSSMEGFLDTIEETISHLKKNYEDPILPKHTLVFGEMRELGDLTKEEHSKVLKRILDIGKNHPYIIENIYLVGEEWLKCDEQDFAKSEDIINYIFFQKQLFKVFKSVKNLKKIFGVNELRPYSWYWFKGSENTIFLEGLVEELLKNPEDSKKLCRRGEFWNKKRKNWTY